MDSVSQFISGLQRGDSVAATRIFERFFDRLVALARRKLEGAPKKQADEEDVVQVTLAEFFRKVQQPGAFSKLQDRNDLWQVIAMMVDRRATDLMRKERAQSRGGGRVSTESIFFQPGDSLSGAGIDGVAGLDPTPELAEQWLNSLTEMLGGVEPRQREMVLMRLQGYGLDEIAVQLSVSQRTVERTFQALRTRYGQEGHCEP